MLTQALSFTVALMLACGFALAQPAIAAIPLTPTAAQTEVIPLEAEPVASEPRELTLDESTLNESTPDAGELVLGEPAPDESIPDESAPSEPVEAAPETTEPKLYFLQIMAGSARRQLTLDPPATKLVITFEAGDAAVRCGVRGASPSGNRLQTYTCSLGKPLTIEREPEQAIDRFWAQDLSELTDVRLRIESYSDL